MILYALGDLMFSETERRVSTPGMSRVVAAFGRSIAFDEEGVFSQVARSLWELADMKIVWMRGAKTKLPKPLCWRPCVVVLCVCVCLSVRTLLA